MESTQTKNNRLAYLDGLRAIAILGVVSFHYYIHVPMISEVSYGNSVGDLFFIRYGNFGVMLFFSISGFVITLTLDSSRSLIHFYSKRFSRLFPTMLICSTLTYIASLVLPIPPALTAYNFLPSLTFLDPRLFNFIFRTTQFEWMDGVYWSLFTEIRFYLIVSLVYFYCKNNFFRNLLYISLFVGLALPFSIYFELNNIRSILNYIFIANQLPWFVFGIGCYYLHNGENVKAITCALASFSCMALYSYSATEKPYMIFDGKTQIVAMIIIFTLLICTIKLQPIKQILSQKALTKIGVASYSIYLLHNDIGERLIQMFYYYSQDHIVMANITLFSASIMIINILFSLILYSSYEKPFNQGLNKLFNKRGSR